VFFIFRTAQEEVGERIVEKKEELMLDIYPIVSYVQFAS